MTTSPATLISVPNWTFLTVSRTLNIVPAVPASGTAAAVPASLAASWTTNLTKGTAEYLGDASGNPVQALQSGMASGTAPAWTAAALDLSEVVTRGDGTKLSVLALLDALAMAAATQA